MDFVRRCIDYVSADCIDGGSDILDVAVVQDEGRDVWGCFETCEHTLKLGIRLRVVVGRVNGWKYSAFSPMCSSALTGGDVSKRCGIEVPRQLLLSSCNF
jgi:hypothetical protein